MLHYNAAMKLTNKKKGIFSFYSHNMDKKFNESHFYRLKLSTISKGKDTHHKYDNFTLHIVKFFIGFDTLIYSIFTLT